jgi:hypothetical protein
MRRNSASVGSRERSGFPATYIERQVLEARVETGSWGLLELEGVGLALVSDTDESGAVTVMGALPASSPHSPFDKQFRYTGLY